MVLLLVLVQLALPATMLAFNVDLRHATVIPSPSSQHHLFGYSVALVADRATPAQ